MRTMIRVFTVMCFLAAIIRADDSDNMIFARDDSQPLTNNNPVADENEVLVTPQTDSSEDLSITPDQFIPIVSDNSTTNNSDSESNSNSDSESDNKSDSDSSSSSDSDSSSSSDSESDSNSDSGSNDSSEGENELDAEQLEQIIEAEGLDRQDNDDENEVVIVEEEDVTVFN
ncbi:unnamed protein product [Adineta steineri]|uniref:Uncharacterized protein n=1 Tax=Adineta steineri TaxID=433720 RepID=A0A815L2D7_9BILA|nr:unnamed protein product [Adineta steineri]CAF1615318.1 unnamed protein product [Adineta steineri]